MSVHFELVYVAYSMAAVLAYLLLKPIVVYFLDPLQLRKYPAPSFLAAVSPLWLLRETRREKRSKTVHEAHKKLGDVIRVGPNQLLFNIPEAVYDIYGHQAARSLSKDHFYDKFASDEYDIVTTRDHADHARRRRYLSNSFALKTVVEMEPIIRENFQRVLNHIDNDVLNKKEEGEFNIRQWLKYFTLDVIGDMAFGIPMGFVFNGGDLKEA